MTLHGNFKLMSRSLTADTESPRTGPVTNVRAWVTAKTKHDSSLELRLKIVHEMLLSLQLNCCQEGTLRPVTFSRELLQPPTRCSALRSETWNFFLEELSFTNPVTLRSPVFSVNKATIPSVA